MTDLTFVVQAIISLAVALITAFLIPYIRSKVKAEDYNNLAYWVGIAVQAAEQIYKDPKMGVEKKKNVIAFLEGKGFTVNMDEIDKLIEATVFQINQKPKQLTVSSPSTPPVSPIWAPQVGDVPGLELTTFKSAVDGK